MSREVGHKVQEVLILSGSVGVIINSKEDTVGVVLLVEAKEEFAVFQCSPAATFAAKDIDIFDKAVTKYGIEWLRVLLQLNLRHKVLPTLFFRLVKSITWQNRHKLITEGMFKCKKASLQELEGISELSLKPEEISKAEQTLVVIEVPLEKVVHVLYVHGSLHLHKFFLKGVVLWRFDKG